MLVIFHFWEEIVEPITCGFIFTAGNYARSHWQVPASLEFASKPIIVNGHEFWSQIKKARLIFSFTP